MNITFKNSVSFFLLSKRNLVDKRRVGRIDFRKRADRTFIPDNQTYQWTLKTDVEKWCSENLTSYDFCSDTAILSMGKEDAVLFKLKWM